MGVTGKGNCKRGQEEQDEDLLGKDTDEKSEVRSGRWAKTGREGRGNKLHTHPGMKPRSLEEVIPLLLPGGTHQQKGAVPSSACADLAQNNQMVAVSQVC